MTRRHRRAHVVAWGLLAIGLAIAAAFVSAGGTRDQPVRLGLVE